MERDQSPHPAKESVNPFGATLVVRADAGERIGTGHVMRCLAISQAWREVGGKTVFVTGPLPAALASRLHAEGADVRHLPGGDDAEETIAPAGELGAKWIILDGYAFGHE